MRDTQRVKREHDAVLGTAYVFWDAANPRKVPRGRCVTGNAECSVRYKPEPACGLVCYVSLRLACLL